MFLSNKNKSNIYYLYFNNPKTGKRNKISCRTTKLNKAQLFLKKFKINWDLKDDSPTFLPQPPKTISISEGEKHIMEYLTLNVSLSTFSHYMYTFKYLKECFGDNSLLNKITFSDSEKFKAFLKNIKTLNATTINWHIRYLRQIVNIGLQLNLYDQKLLDCIKMIRIPESEPLAFTEDEIRLLLLKLPKKLNTIIEFTLNTGLRISELINLRICDIDFVDKKITIRNHNEFSTKTRIISSVPLNTRAIYLLKEIIHENNYIDLNTKIFINKFGNPFTRNSLTMWFKLEIRKLNLPERFHFHCLRHTFITNLINKGVSLNKVKALARHSSINTTLRYIHKTEKELFEAVESLN